MLVISLARLIVEAQHTMLIGDVGEAVLVRMRARTRRLRHPPDPRERNDERATSRNRAPASINKTTTYKNNLEELRNHNAWPERHITARPPGAEVLAELDYAIAALRSQPPAAPGRRRSRSIATSAVMAVCSAGSMSGAKSGE